MLLLIAFRVNPNILPLDICHAEDVYNRLAGRQTQARWKKEFYKAVIFV
jgi:hypothetical protein